MTIMLVGQLVNGQTDRDGQKDKETADLVACMVIDNLQLQ